MKIKGSFIMREIVGETILVPTGNTALKMNGMIPLDPVATIIWKGIENNLSKQEILQQILDQFEIDENTARVDLDEFLIQLKEADLLEE